jgi:phospholipid/cholesterol/gamma-HCH transport system permease protein
MPAAAPSPLRPPGPLRRAVEGQLAALGRFGVFAGAVGARAARGRVDTAEVARSTWTTASRCLLPVFAVTLPVGMVIALQGLEIFRMFGAERLLGSLVSVAVLRELSPVLASVLVAAQGGSSVAAELGSMRIKEEIDATDVMAVDPLAVHVLPRVLALMITCPLLNVVGSAAGIAGGWLTACVLKGEPSGVYLSNMWDLTQPVDMWAGVIKTVVFGLIIGLIAAFHGYHASGGAAGVGRAVNDTVVHSVLAFISANYLLTNALFGDIA